MAKLARARISGVDGMAKHTAADLAMWEKDLREQVSNPRSRDDPRWLGRWADKLDKLADKKEKSREHKAAQSRKPRVS